MLLAGESDTMGKLRFSVIVPVFNKAAFLGCSFDSILSQLTDEDELILVDDGSVDGSERICDEYAERYRNVKTIHQVNQGVSAARNNGIRVSSGQYLIFIDCDDTIEAGLTDRAFSLMEDSKLMIFGMSFDYYSHDDLIRTEVLAYPEDCVYTRRQVSEKIGELFSTNSLSSACNKVFLGNVIRDNELFFNEKMYLYEDLDFVLKYLSFVPDGGLINIVNHAYYHYRLSAEQANLVSRVSDLHKLMSNMNELKNGFDAFSSSGKDSSVADKLYMGIYLDLIYLHLIDSHDLKSSIKTLYSEFKSADSHMKLEGNRKVIFDCISHQNEKELEAFIRRRKLKRTAKRTIKKMLGK